MLKKKVVLLFFPRFVEQFRKFNDSIYPGDLSKEKIKKGVLLLSKRNNDVELLDDDDTITNLAERFKKHFDISHIENSESVVNSLKEKISEFYSFVFINYPRSEDQLSEIMNSFSLNREKIINDNEEEIKPLSLDFRIILLYIDYETIKDIISDSHQSFSEKEKQDKEKEFDKETNDYFEVTKRVINQFINLNDGDSSKVSIITMKKKDLLSGDLIKDVWNSIV